VDKKGETGGERHDAAEFPPPPDSS
jgi:hypothetical protein